MVSGPQSDPVTRSTPVPHTVWLVGHAPRAGICSGDRNVGRVVLAADLTFVARRRSGAHSHFGHGFETGVAIIIGCRRLLLGHARRDTTGLHRRAAVSTAAPG